MITNVKLCDFGAVKTYVSLAVATILDDVTFSDCKFAFGSNGFVWALKHASENE